MPLPGQISVAINSFQFETTRGGPSLSLRSENEMGSKALITSSCRLVMILSPRLITCQIDGGTEVLSVTKRGKEHHPVSMFNGLVVASAFIARRWSP